MPIAHRTETLKEDRYTRRCHIARRTQLEDDPVLEVMAPNSNKNEVNSDHPSMNQKTY